MYLIRTRVTSRFCARTRSSARLILRAKLAYHRSLIDRSQRLERSTIPVQTHIENTHRGRSSAREWEREASRVAERRRAENVCPDRCGTSRPRLPLPRIRPQPCVPEQGESGSTRKRWWDESEPPQSAVEKNDGCSAVAGVVLVSPVRARRGARPKPREVAGNFAAGARCGRGVSAVAD